MVPKSLKKGDKIALIAPAKRIEKKYVDFAVQFIEKQGFQAIVSKHCLGSNNYFSGTPAERTADFQWAIDADEISGIICARGGYGSIQILEKLNWEPFKKSPKWLVGFSDITVFHQFFSLQNMASVHASMPLNFEDNSSASLSSLFSILKGENITHKWHTTGENKKGKVEAQIIGGNLTVCCSLIGTKFQPDFNGKILFIEDVGEALYAIDRSFYQLKNAGILDQISGLIVGNFSEIKDSDPPFGSDLQKLILSHFPERKIPLAFDFPGGHCPDNRALAFGIKSELIVEDKSATLNF